MKQMPGQVIDITAYIRVTIKINFTRIHEIVPTIIKMQMADKRDMQDDTKKPFLQTTRRQLEIMRMKKHAR